MGKAYGSRSGGSHRPSPTAGYLGALCLAATLVGCSSDRGGSSQFRAADGEKASLVYYVGMQMPNDESVRESMRGKVLACWYRSDVQISVLKEKLSKEKIDGADAYAVVFDRTSRHERITRFPGLCEDFPAHMQRRVLADNKDYSGMCKSEYDKESLVQAMRGQPAAGTMALNGFSWERAAQAGAPFLIGTLFGNRGEQNAPATGNPGFSNILQGAIVPAVLAGFSPPRSEGVSQDSSGPISFNAADLLPALIGVGIGQLAQNSNSPFMAQLGNIVSTTLPAITNGARPDWYRLGTDLGGLLARDGEIRLGGQSGIAFEPSLVGGVFERLFGRAEQPGTSQQAQQGTPETPAQPAQPGQPAAPAQAAQPSGSIDEAHPEVSMAQLDAIVKEGQTKLGQYFQLTQHTGLGINLNKVECPSSFQ